MTRGKIGLFAGSGGIVALAIEELSVSGERPVVFTFDENLPADVRLSFGDVEGFFSAAKRENIRRIVLAGKIEARELLTAGAAETFPGGLRSLAPEKVLAAAVRLLAVRGIRVLPLTAVFARHLAGARLYSRAKPDAAVRADIAAGWKAAKAVARLGIGQAVAVNRGMTVAVEAVEGTDAMIERAGACAKGFTVVKVMRRGQSVLYDLPTAGPETIRKIAAAGGRALAVEAGRTVVVEIERTVGEADRQGIVFLGTRGRIA